MSARPYPPARPDDYWAAYIVPIHGETEMEIVIDITSATGSDAELEALDAAYLRVEYIAYGPHGRTPQEQQVVLPLRFPAAAAAPAPATPG